METLNLMKGFLALGNMDQDQTLEQKVAYKQKIVFATMRASIPEWQAPRGWDNLTDEVKMERLTQIESVI